MVNMNGKNQFVCHRLSWIEATEKKSQATRRRVEKQDDINVSVEESEISEGDKNQ